MKRFFTICLVLLLLPITGCTNENKINDSNNYYVEGEGTKEFYTSIKVVSDYISNIYTYIDSTIGDLGVVGYGDDYYYPEVVFRFNEKGKVENFTITGYFLDGKDDYRWADEAFETYQMSTSELKKQIVSAKKGRVNDFVSFVRYEFEYDEDYYYNFNQFINAYLLERQDIEKFKEETHYSRLYNYDAPPECIDEEGHFSCPLELLDVYWSKDKNAFDTVLEFERQ